MMDNPDLDIHKAVADYYQQYYPVTAALLTDYYWTLEERTRTSNRLLPLYGTMNDMCHSYLDAKEFVRFRSSLDAMSKNTAKDERKRLNSLLTAWHIHNWRCIARASCQRTLTWRWRCARY